MSQLGGRMVSRNTIYVGRVGALAIALGIGGWAGLVPVVAWADTADSANGTSSSESGESSKSSASSSSSARSGGALGRGQRGARSPAVSPSPVGPSQAPTAPSASDVPDAGVPEAGVPDAGVPEVLALEVVVSAGPRRGARSGGVVVDSALPASGPRPAAARGRASSPAPLIGAPAGPVTSPAPSSVEARGVEAVVSQVVLSPAAAAIAGVPVGPSVGALAAADSCGSCWAFGGVGAGSGAAASPVGQVISAVGFAVVCHASRRRSVAGSAKILGMTTRNGHRCCSSEPGIRNTIPRRSRDGTAYWASRGTRPWSPTATAAMSAKSPG